MDGNRPPAERKTPAPRFKPIVDLVRILIRSLGMKKKSKAKSPSKTKSRRLKVKMPPVPRSDELPVTQAMLFIVRDELKAGQRSLGRRIDSLDSKIDSLGLRVDSLELRIDSLEARIDGLEAKMDSKFEAMSAQLHQMMLLIEEQNHRNTIVLDGLRSLFERQDRVETRLREIDKF